MVDENFLLVAAHVDDSVRRKVELGEYVDFAHLLLTDKVMNEHSTRMEWVQEGGQTFLVPAGANKDKQGITSFHRWEQAFRVFSDIFTRAHPDRAA